MKILFLSKVLAGTHPCDRTLVALEPVEATLVDHVPNNEARVLRPRGQTMTILVKGQAHDPGLVAV